MHKTEPIIIKALTPLQGHACYVAEYWVESRPRHADTEDFLVKGSQLTIYTTLDGFKQATIKYKGRSDRIFQGCYHYFEVKSTLSDPFMAFEHVRNWLL